MSDKPSLLGQAKAFWLQGLKDLHNQVTPAFPTSYRGLDEPGTPTSPTSQMVTEDLQGESFDDAIGRHAQQARETGGGLEAGL